MHHLTRRGFTLVELLIALILLGVVTTAFYRSLTTNQRVYQKQTQVIDLQQNMRAAVAILPQELRELDASDSDIVAMSPDSIRFRAHRWTGFLCEAPVTAGTLTGGLLTGLSMTVRRNPFYGDSIDKNDTVFVRFEGDDATRRDDGWVRVLLNATPAAKGCPDGAPGQVMNLSLALSPLQVFGRAIPVGSPVLGYRIVTYGLYQPNPGPNADWYLGFTNPSGVRQPLVGPLLPNGLTLTYYNASGVVTTARDSVARIDIVVRGLTRQAVRPSAGTATPAQAVDSIRTSVAVRNNRRY